MKTKKIIIAVLLCFVLIVGAVVGTFIYNTKYKLNKIDSTVSPDGNYTLTLYSVGEPDFPFGYAYGRIVMEKGEKKISETDIDLAIDGCQIGKDNWSVTWESDGAKVILSADEQQDERGKFYFDGRADLKLDPFDAEPTKPVKLKMNVGENDRGEAVFKIEPENFVSAFNAVYRKNHSENYLTPFDEWTQLDDPSVYFEHDSRLHRFSSDAQISTMPTLSAYTPVDGEGIYEFVLTFCDHGYQKTMYTEFEEMSLCTLSTFLPDLNGTELEALYKNLYAQTNVNFWGHYYPNTDEKRPDLAAIYRYGDVGLYGYYGPGTANIGIIPLTESVIAELEKNNTEIRSAK